VVNKDIVKIRKRLVGFKRVPTLIEVGNYKSSVPMYYVFQLDPITQNTKLLSLTVTDELGLLLTSDIYYKLGINLGSRKETSLVVLLADLVLANKAKITYPKGTLSNIYSITLELGQFEQGRITYKLFADNNFYAYLNLEYKGLDQLGYNTLGIDDTVSDTLKDAISIVYSILLKDYSSEKELVYLCEKLSKYYTPTLYSKLRSEHLTL
jgi:hypothetical protein